MTQWTTWSYPYRRADPRILDKPMFKYPNAWKARAPIRKQADQEIARAFAEYDARDRFELTDGGCDKCKIYLETIKFYNTVLLIVIAGLVAKVVLDSAVKTFKKNNSEF